MYRIVLVLLMTASCPLLAEEVRNCPQNSVTTAGSCHAQPTRQSMMCDEERNMTPRELESSQQQLRRLRNFALGVFSPGLPGYDLREAWFSRADLIKRFGQPLRTKSREVSPYDPSDPIEIETTWEYRGFRIVTAASKPRPDNFQLREGEVFDARVSLRYGVRVGQPIELWMRQFGRPITFCSEHLNYEGEYYFQCGKNNRMSCVATYLIQLFLDDSGKVQSMRWSHPML